MVLARALLSAATLAEGVAAYVAERRRAAWIVAGAYLSGWVQQGGTSVHGVRGYMVKLFGIGYSTGLCSLGSPIPCGTTAVI